RLPAKLEMKPPGTGSQNANVKGIKVTAPDSVFPYLLVQEKNPHVYQDMSLSKAVAGMSDIVPEDTIIINPVDAAKIGIGEGDSLMVKSADSEKGNAFPIRRRRTVSPGYLHLVTSAETFPFGVNPSPVQVSLMSKEEPCLK
ncbi:MAG: hypothetical protein GY940_25520, partial [bacterium]|nr:hypothetical protein [bacterium]